ncbi:MAG: hypothetical protein QOC69_2596 [Mycobacterium sp.]|jgi:hypothetical protein|nr:hypothetical protein [Mycobacterium sp.]
MGVSIPIITACSGFLLAVLWMDVMFDVQVLAHRHAAELPEAAIASVAGYYHRVTTASRPMSHLVAGVMAILLITLGLRVASGHDPLWLIVVSVPLAVVPILLALLRTVPNAVRLGRRAESAAEQTRRARAICLDHLLCIGCLVLFVGFWLGYAATSAIS